MILRPIARVVVTLCMFSVALAAAPQGTQNFNDLVARAAAASEQNNVPLAVELYSQALKINPKWMQGWWFIGLLQYNAGQFASARDSLTHFLDFGPDPEGFALRGMCEFETGEYADSLSDIQRGISLGAGDQPRNEQALHFYEAMLLTRLGRFDEGLRSYVYFAEHQVANPEVLLGIGLAGLRMPLLPKDVSKDQQQMLVLTGAAVYDFFTGDAKSANAFDSLFQRFPTANNLHYLYGSLLYTEEPYAAQKQFEAELKVDSSNQRARTMLAWVLLMGNHPADALPYAREAAQAQPGMASAQLALGRSLSETGDVNAALDHLKRALQLDPDNLEIHMALASAYSQAGQVEEARRERSWCIDATKDGRNRLALP